MTDSPPQSALSLYFDGSLYALWTTSMSFPTGSLFHVYNLLSQILSVLLESVASVGRSDGEDALLVFVIKNALEE